MRNDDGGAFAPCILIPVYDHAEGIVPTVLSLLPLNLPILLVDDGSGPACRAALDRLAGEHAERVSLVRRPRNGGKGAAMQTGFAAARAAGHTHALQVDADGQHEIADVPGFLEAARAHPGAVVCGVPVYDDSVPRSRLYGRYATHVWVWINTLSTEIRDSMCGFRVYPLDTTLAVFDREYVGRRMDFDTEIIVRLFWRGLRVINRPTRVRYPSDGVSHFRLWGDNLRITLMHTRLFFGMLRRLPRLLRRRGP